jgi:outer membrane protein OmpA-like peptidoglycan-associated protein
MRKLSLLSLGLTLTVAAACKKEAAMSTTPTPPPDPAPAAAAPEPDPEPETEPVVAAEPKNLEIQKNVIRLKPGIKILFETDSASLMASSNEILDEVASVLDQNQRIRIRVEGHTDNTGKADHNKDLSAKRAASVMAYLATKGVAQERLESTGCGQDVPIADNANEDGRQQNRRVEFVILRKRRVAEPCQVYKPRERRKRDGEAAPAPAPTP